MARPKALPDERATVERAQRGDARAFEQIYRHYAPILFSYVLMPMLRDRDDAHDCVRETFISAHKALPDYQWRGESIYPWLKTMTKNKARDLLRASGRRQRLRGAFAEHLADVGPEPKNPAEEGMQRLSLRQQIEQVLDTLNPRYSRVLRLRLLEDRSRDEVAELMEVKVATLDVLLYRAVRAFRTACDKGGLKVEGITDGA